MGVGGAKFKVPVCGSLASAAPERVLSSPESCSCPQEVPD